MPTRPIIFWIATLAAVIAVVVLLRRVLLPFVAGIALAYLLSPIANRIERLGISRGLATLSILVVVVVVIAVLVVLIVPMIVNEVSYLVENVPMYFRRLQAMSTDPNRPWLSKIVGEGLVEAERALGELTNHTGDSLGAFLLSIWSGGEALISVISLALVAPIISCYLIYDWNRMVAAIDNWVPPARREIVRALASEIDGNIRGVVRGQSLLCLVLAAFYASALWLIGLNHGVLIGFAAGLLSFIPLSRRAFRPGYFHVHRDRAILAGLDGGPPRACYLFCRAVARGLCFGAVSRRPARAFESGVDPVCAIRLRLSVWFCRPLDCAAVRGRHWRADAICPGSVLCKPLIRRRCARCAVAQDRRINCSRRIALA